MDNTKIEWCDSTWNPVTGCLHDCEYCYARKQANRFKGFIPMDSSGATGVYYHEENSPIYEVCEPLSVRRKSGEIAKAPYPFGFAPTLHYDRLFDVKYWKTPRTIFVGSMADLFGGWVPNEWIEQVFEACEDAPQHLYLFLTKNPERYSRLANSGRLPQRDNMWYGTSVTKSSDRYFTSLKHNTFLSIEPLLEEKTIGFGDAARVEWIILGAETGNRKDKVVPKAEWIDFISKTAALVGTPVFMKDSLLPIIGESSMRREVPWERLTNNPKFSK